MDKGHLKLVAVCAMVGLVLMVAGCAQKKIPAKPEEAPASAFTGDTPGAVESLDAKPMERSTLPIMEGRTTGPMLPIYFDFDKDAIRDDQKGRMETNAKHLKSIPNTAVTIEGNCDERGTNEYNVALGDRRANSAKKYLATKGVDVSKLSTVSYGEESPLNFGHDELAWSQNRRDDFVQMK